MYCTKCGNSIEGKKFCNACGQPVGQQAPPYAAPNGPAPRKQGFGKLALIVPLVLVVALAGGGAFFLFNRVTPLLAAERALGNFTEEFRQRIDGSPFGAISMLADALEGGFVAANIAHENRNWGSSTRINFDFHADDARREYMLNLNADVEGIRFDLEGFMDRNSLAVRVPQVDSSFYGINFATFRSDFRQFAREIGLSEWEINEIADAVDMVREALNAPSVDDSFWDEYTAMLTDFLTAGEMSSASETIASGGQSVSVTRTEFYYSMRDITDFLRDFLNALRSDSRLDPLGTVDPWMWDDMMSEFDAAVREMEREVAGGMTLALYIGPQNRLVRASVAFDARPARGGDGESATLAIVGDFGTSVFSPWRFTISTRIEEESWSDSSRTDISEFEIELLWTYEVSGGRHVNTIEATVTEEQQWWNSRLGEMDAWSDTSRATIASEWNSGSGAFTLSVADEWDRYEFGGNFMPDARGGFELRLDPIDLGWGDEIRIVIRAGLGANITPVRDFINADQWNAALLDRLANLGW